MRTTHRMIAVALLSLVGLAACSNTAAGVEDDATRASEKAAEAVDEAAREAARATAAVVETIDVKSALMADRTVDASHIDVDTFPETKTIVLKGSVKTSAERDEAERIAGIEAPGYKIDNQLKVVSNPGLQQFR
jgi:osmotically-inducible protein OsmY